MFRLYSAFKEAFRLWVRQRTRPLSIEEAEEKRFFWAKVYAIVSFGIMGYFTYLMHTGYLTLPEMQTPSKYRSGDNDSVKDQQIRFITFQGLKKVQDVTCTKEEFQLLKMKSNKDSALKSE